MAHVGIPILALDRDVTWCRVRALRLAGYKASWAHATGSAMADRKFIDDTVKAHNEYRHRHQASPLTHSKELSAQAQKWAEHLAASNSFQHSNASLQGERLGENIAMKWSSQPEAYTGQDVTDQWYSEVKMHSFGTEPRTTGTGHFSQVVWRSSREVGVGRAVSRDGKVIVVANYRPAGNVVGSYTANVLPPSDGKILLPPEPAHKPTPTHTGQRTQEGTFSHRFEDARRDFFSRSEQFGSQPMGTRSESRSVRTYTVTEGVGPNKVTKTVTEETIIKPNGQKVVNRKETTTTGGATPASAAHGGADVGRLAISDHSRQDPAATKTSNPFCKGSQSSARDTSCPERDKLASKPRTQPKMAAFDQDCLQAHNSKRALHGSAPLSLASDLSDHAQKWADYLASNDKFEHSKCMVGSERVGENIACSWSSAGADYTGDQVVDQWYSEIKKHDYKSDGAMGSGHFTQVVWKGSRELGVGKAQDGKGKYIVVCNYRPAGNMVGTYKDNVVPPQ